MNSNYKSIIFDLGGVLIDWKPEYVFLNAFDGDKEKTDWFIKNICTLDWNENQDAGYPIAQATEELVSKHPEWEEYIRMYYGNWEQMLGGPISETVDILKKLIAKETYQIVALTNWSNETFPIALERFEFLHWFEGIIVSGAEKTRKPFSEIYELTIDRFDIDATKAIFIDDNLRNIKAAENIGIKGIHFKSPQLLQNELNFLNIL
ncbi:HAD family hydrolase [Aegicerativicinus sediminis]|uniref:HAD family hydrolase n=1 Tax=Aegicerativicinus sediminis TaxID=2893202 RepID=UPI001E45967C|nr:HAD family phosphatase [Aegicerativicinus sediminis]